VQQLITLALLPLAEGQADPLSFSFRPNRTKKQAVNFIHKALLESIRPQLSRYLKPKEVDKKCYLSFTGKKSKYRTLVLWSRSIFKKKKNLYNYRY